MQIPADQVSSVVTQALQVRYAEQRRMQRISRYMRGKHDPPYIPKGASAEFRWITRRSKRNFLPLIVSTVSQNMHVDGYRRSGQTIVETDSTETPDPAWEAFRANRMISRQHGVHRSVMKYGIAYVTVLPGSMGYDEEDVMPGPSLPVICPSSPRRMTALYADDVDDEWPEFAIEERVITDYTAPQKERRIIKLYDDTNRYILYGPDNAGGYGLIKDGDPMLPDGQTAVMAHDLGVCPVVRFFHEADLDGETDCMGEVEPIIEIQDQINFDTFNLMMAEQYASFRQRWVTGMAPADQDGAPKAPFNPGVDRVWAAEDATTRFGEFSATELQPYIGARDSGIQHMSTVSQVPPYYLLGQVANLSADALAAARDGLDRKVSELKSVNTDSWRNVFRLSAKAAGDSDGWNDLNGTVVWRDTSARALSATIDALGKAAQMLGIPVEELWRLIPGATADDVNRWAIAKQREDAQAAVQQALQQAQSLQQQAQTAEIAQGTYPAPPVPPGSAPPPSPGQNPGGPAAITPGPPGPNAA